MNAVFRRVAVAFLMAALRKLGQAAVPAGVAQLGPLGKLLALLPVADIVALIEQRATVDTTIDLAERVAGIVKIAFPPGALTAAEVGFALEALKFVLDAAGVGSSPVRGGEPDIIGQENSFNEKDR